MFNEESMQVVCALRNLGRNPRRTIAVMLTIAVGTCCLQIFAGFNRGLMTHFRETAIRQRYGNGLLNLQGYREKVYEKPWEHWLSNFSRISQELASRSGVVGLYPRVSFSSLLQNGGLSRNATGQGIVGEKESQFFTTMNIVSGKMLTDESDGAVLGSGLADALGVKVGDPLSVLAHTVNGSMNAVDVRIVGIFHTGAKRFDDVMFRIPLTLAQQLLDTDKVETIAVGLSDPERWTSFAAEASVAFPELEATPFERIDKVYYGNTMEFLDSQFRIVLTIILAIVTLGILNSVSTNVLERRQELGCLRANGESRSAVLQLVTVEGLILGMLASTLGVAFAYTLTRTLLAGGVLWPPGPGMTASTLVHFELHLGFAAATVLLGTVCALVGTILAGIRVTRTGIAEMLRSH